MRPRPPADARRPGSEGLAAGWTTPWIWPARPPHEFGGALCAAGVFAAGIVFITLRGARVFARE